uniref:NmrA domain-containing protein n=1 Tax=Macrostomum lignano TaxID=282301 RepID=A0A1I8HI86_9PLAT
ASLSTMSSTAEQKQRRRIVLAGSGLLTDALLAKLAALPDDFQQPATRLPDADSLQDPTAVSAALAGADALFVELPAEPADPDCLTRSQTAAVNLIAGARDGGVSHVICCTAASPLRILGVSARRMDAWAQAEPLWRDSGLPVTYLVLPPIDMMDADDIAEIVLNCLQLGNGCYGRCLPLSAGKITVQQLVEILSRELGVHVIDQKITCEQLRSRGDAASIDLGNAFEFVLRVDQQLKRSVAERYLEPRRPVDFADWCARNREQLLAALERP